MYGLIVKMTITPGKRDEMVEMLASAAKNMPGCASYVVAKDSGDPDVLWVTEVWDSEVSHDASLSLRAVQEMIPQARELVANLEKVAVTAPVWGVGLASEPFE